MVRRVAIDKENAVKLLIERTKKVKLEYDKCKVDFK